MKAIKNFHLDTVATDIRRNLSSINSMGKLFYLNNDTKHLTKLLTAERGVCDSLSTLTYEQNETAKYLSIWGKSEGADLSDITEKLAILIAKLSESEGTLAKRYAQYRGHLKDIRSREETMREQRLKKESLWNKIEKEERKASHSKRPEVAEQKLKDFQKELEKVDRESLEADFKRQKLQTALLLQLDAFLEFGEKLIIIANNSKDIVEQISTETTTPGESRKTYTGYEKTSQAISNATVALSTWTPKPRLNDSIPISTTTTTSDIDLSSSIPPSGLIVPTPPTLDSSIRNSTSGSPLTDDDSNEADHSDLDHSEIETESPRYKGAQSTEIKQDFKGTSIIDNEKNENESEPDVFSSIPRPPTPPKVKIVSTDDSEQEKPPSIREPTINENNENNQTLSQESAENSHEKLAIPSATKTKPHKQKDLKYVHFSDVEDEIP
ncbi:14378_t:CDS:2 [Funneliformis geosporum]|uniref:17315_t:CDS:1 n=1 Tax=Funneliformis geosporum TaxID=1117311 RepID=A0A9W4SUS4_9GLOM|nr:14378_t:CDS:2 [Funneliformis geosporum]CAI2182333.1 17315_t:CDS:2 [Funneliformis geosporum]